MKKKKEINELNNTYNKKIQELEKELKENEEHVNGYEKNIIKK